MDLYVDFFTYELTPFPKWFLLNSIPYVHQLYGIRCRNTILFVLFYLFVALVKPINKSTCINLNIPVTYVRGVTVMDDIERIKNQARDVWM
ncbi:hypothetical protein YC2023_055479 [Brassica napus]